MFNQTKVDVGANHPSRLETYSSGGACFLRANNRPILMKVLLVGWYNYDKMGQKCEVEILEENEWRLAMLTTLPDEN
eukprot:430844-Ditylum_brightwellii.AAC.1